MTPLVVLMNVVNHVFVGGSGYRDCVILMMKERWGEFVCVLKSENDLKANKNNVSKKK